MTDRPEDDFDDADMAELGALIRRARPEEVEWQAPPDGLWDRIAAAIDTDEEASAPTTLDEAPLAPVVPITARRRRWWVGLSAAAALLIAVTVGALVVGGDGDDGRGEGARPVAPDAARHRVPCVRGVGGVAGRASLQSRRSAARRGWPRHAEGDHAAPELFVVRHG